MQPQNQISTLWSLFKDFYFLKIFFKDLNVFYADTHGLPRQAIAVPISKSEEQMLCNQIQMW